MSNCNYPAIKNRRLAQKINTFKAFRSRNYTLYFVGRSVSQFGTWMQRTAVVWVIYTMTHSAFMLGVTIFAEQFPSFILSLLGGIASDRYDRYKIVKITQIASMVQATVLAVLMITGTQAVWSILVLSVLLGIINAFDVPARQALIHEVLYEEADLPNALSLNSAMASLARLAGPALAGIILQKLGAGTCFLLNAASFGTVIISLALMKLPPSRIYQKKNKVSTELKDGFVYLKKRQDLALIITILALTSLLVLPYDTLLPLFAKIVFKGNAATFGYITSFIGLGAVGGTIFLASLKPATNLKRILIITIISLGIGLIFFSQIQNFWWAMPFAVIIGFGSVAQGTISNTIIQMETSAKMRGRIISIMIMAMFGMLPLGSLVVGAVTQVIGAPNTILGQGILALVLAFYFRNILSGKRQPAQKITSDETKEVILENI